MTLARIQFVTQNFQRLQGLRFVPVGLFLLFMAADSWGLLNALPGKPAGPGDAGNAWDLFAWSGATLGAYLAVDRYRSRYGNVVPHKRGAREILAFFGICGFVSGVTIDSLIEFPFLIGPAALTAALVATVAVDGRERVHYLIPATGWFAVSQLPSANLSVDITFAHYFLFGGLTLIVCGIGDHLVLMKGLRQFREMIRKEELIGKDAIV